MRRAGSGGGGEVLTWLPSTVPASRPLEPDVLQETGLALGQEAQGSACVTAPDGVAQLWLSSQGHSLPGVGVKMSSSWRNGQDMLWECMQQTSQGVGLSLLHSPSCMAWHSPGLLSLLLIIWGLPVRGEPHIRP